MNRRVRAVTESPGAWLGGDALAVALRTPASTCRPRAPGRPIPVVPGGNAR
jgi:hypothetical protein